MCLTAERAGDEQLFLLPRAVAADVLFELDTGEIQLAEYGAEQTYIYAAFLFKTGEGAAELGCILLNVGNRQSLCYKDIAACGCVFAADELYNAGLAAAVASAQRYAVALLDYEGEIFAHGFISVAD